MMFERRQSYNQGVTMFEDEKESYPAPTKEVHTAGMLRVHNPTMRENIDQKIQMHKDEILRLEAIKEKLPQLLDVNLRDLREAMNF